MKQRVFVLAIVLFIAGCKQEPKHPMLGDRYERIKDNSRHKVEFIGKGSQVQSQYSDFTNSLDSAIEWNKNYAQAWMALDLSSKEIDRGMRNFERLSRISLDWKYLDSNKQYVVLAETLLVQLPIFKEDYKLIEK